MTFLDSLPQYGKWERNGGFMQPADYRFPNLPGVMLFFGNFWARSSGFSIFTDEPETIAKLTVAIRQNLASTAYKEARAIVGER